MVDGRKLRLVDTHSTQAKGLSPQAYERGPLAGASFSYHFFLAGAFFLLSEAFSFFGPLPKPGALGLDRLQPHFLHMTYLLSLYHLTLSAQYAADILPFSMSAP